MAAFRFLRLHPAATALILVVVAGAAFATDRIIRISTDGKSASEIQSDIQGALASEGFGDAEVSVTDAGEGRREIKIGIDRENDGSAPEAPMPEIVLTKDGQDLGDGGGEACQVKVKKMMTDGGTATMVLDVTKGGSSASIEIADADNMDDYALQSAIQSELDRAGLDLRASVSGGRVDIE